MSYNSTILIDQEMSKQSFCANEKKKFYDVSESYGFGYIAISWKYYSIRIIRKVLFFYCKGVKVKTNQHFSRNHIDTKLFGQSLSFITIYFQT